MKGINRGKEVILHSGDDGVLNRGTKSSGTRPAIDQPVR